MGPNLAWKQSFTVLMPTEEVFAGEGSPAPLVIEAPLKVTYGSGSQLDLSDGLLISMLWLLKLSILSTRVKKLGSAL